MDTSRAATILSHALALFADDGTVKPHGSFAVGTHYRETKTLVLRLKVEPSRIPSFFCRYISMLATLNPEDDEARRCQGCPAR